MAQLVSASTEQVGAPLDAGYPQVMTIVQEFDQPVIVSEDFQLVFYGNGRSTELTVQRGEMAAKPTQFIANQLVYTMQVSPFAVGRLGVQRQIGSIQDLYGNDVNLKIGNDFDIYNTTMKPFFGFAALETGWTRGSPWPDSAVCPVNTPPTSKVKIGPWTNALSIPRDLWNGGNFYLWMNITFKPDLTSQGIPFVWEAPFYYAYSGFGFPLSYTQTPDMPPWPNAPEQSINYNICSSGAGSQGVYDTCGWIEGYDNWRGRVQYWCFGSDVFSDGVVPWQNPAVADPTGDLSPYSVFGFPQSVPEQFFLQAEFLYNRT